MLSKSINSSLCQGETWSKILPQQWTIENRKIIIDASWRTSFSSMLAITALIACLTVLLLRGILRWITKYKLLYLFRISFILFIFSTATLFFPFDILFSFIASYFQEYPLIIILSGKYQLWCFFFMLSFLMAVVRYHWALPIIIMKGSGSLQFDSLSPSENFKHRTVREISGKVKRHREPGELNPVYVNGWIPLINSREVAQGKVISISAIGYKFCIYRGEDGQVHVIDAYCPHLGADLSSGGKVVGNCIECPFHGWQFSGQSGKCTNIPYTEKIPDIAKIKVWQSCEKNGYVFVWHHAENEPPSWELPSVPEIESGKWIYRGRSEFSVHCHIQDIPENGADIAHLDQVHSRLFILGSELRNATSDDWFKHDWKPQWSPDEKESHVATIKIVQRLLICGYEVPYSRIDVDIKQIGPATVYLYVDTKFGSGVFLQYITTEGPMLQKVVQEFYTDPKFKPFPASSLIWGEAIMFERDIAVWNHKKFLKNPLLVKEDKLISKFRRWFSQFYSEHSPTLKDLKQRTLDW